MPAPVGLVEVDQIRVDLLGPTARRKDDLVGEHGESYGSESSGGFFPDAIAALIVRNPSQYRRAADVAVFVSQHSAPLRERGRHCVCDFFVAVTEGLTVRHTVSYYLP